MNNIYYHTTKWIAYFDWKLWPNSNRFEFLTDILTVFLKFWPDCIFCIFWKKFDQIFFYWPTTGQKKIPNIDCDRSVTIEVRIFFWLCRKFLNPCTFMPYHFFSAHTLQFVLSLLHTLELPLSLISQLHYFSSILPQFFAIVAQFAEFIAIFPRKLVVPATLCINRSRTAKR